MEAIFCAGKAFFLLLAGRNGHQKAFGVTALVRKLGMHTLYLLIVYHLFYFICVHYADWTKWRSAFFLDNFQQLLPKEVRNKKPMVQLLTKIVLGFLCTIKNLSFNFDQKLSDRFFVFA